MDPLASGLLIICTGKLTKKIDEYQAQEKEYLATFRLGATTPCFDLEKEIDQTYPTEHITETLVQQAIAEFVGTIQQTPPIFSAVKIAGTRAYDSARANKEVVIEPRTITISEFEIVNINFPDVHVRIVCSKGTYIRAIARDLGQKLNSGAHLVTLKRTRIGNFSVENALDIETILNDITKLETQACS